MLHDDLWTANRDLAHACLAHPFVRGLADGSLPRAAFACYVAQDAFFLQAFFRAYALAAAKCKRAEEAECFHRFMGGVLDELKVHKSYSAGWGIDLSRVEPLAATRAYTDFLLRTAWHADAGQTAAAMAPCMRLYAFLGCELAKTPTPDNPYDEWITNYSSAEFDALAGEVESLLDRVATDGPGVRDAYRYAMRCELDFFSAPLEVET
ncbi:MAG TPA: TenA family protein [Phycisphaerae bacterium]|nr:TenA family protein [Phycisphaerae bacterium]